MIAYEVLRDCSISYTDRGEDHGGFVLYKGDYIFIEPDFAWIKKESRLNFEAAYAKKSLLKNIYHNKLVWFGDNPEDTKYKWTWIKNINIIDPKIRQFDVSICDKFNPLFGDPFIKDVTQQWEREIKLNEIINF
jgi:hypothetical protein